MTMIEIVKAWEEGKLPNEIAALGPIHSEVRDHYLAAVQGGMSSSQDLVKLMYTTDEMVYGRIELDILQMLQAEFGKVTDLEENWLAFLERERATKQVEPLGIGERGTMSKPTDLEVLLEMSKGQNNTIETCTNFVSVDFHTFGGNITMCVSEPQFSAFLHPSRRWVPVLFLVDQDEFQRIWDRGKGGTSD